MISLILPALVRAQEGGKSGLADGRITLSQLTNTGSQSSEKAVAPATKEPAGQSRVVVEIPRSQWCQCVRALLNVEGGNIAGCVASGASEEKLQIFRARGTGGERSTTVSALLAFAGCTEKENENVGSLSFDIQWQGLPVSPLPSKAATSVPQPVVPGAPITCAASGISTVEATLYRSSGAKLASAVPWNCSNPIGTLNNIPASSKIRLVVTGKNSSGSVLYRGEQDGITITYAKTTAIGNIPALPFTPTLSAPSDAALLASGHVRFTWAGTSGTASYRIQISENPQFTQTTIDTATSSPSYETDRDLASRVFYWRVMAKDAFNNSSDWSPPWSIEVDANPPTNTTSDNFINSGQKITSLPTVTLAISAFKKTGVAAYYISEQPKKPAAHMSGWVSLPSPVSYSANIRYTLSKGDGVKKVSVWFKDARGRLSRVKSDSIVLDTSLPHTTITAHPPQLTNSLSAIFGYSSSKPGSTFQCQLDGGAYTACSGTTSYKGLLPGTHIFTVKATDAGNHSETNPPSFSWTIDTTPPHTTITSQPLAWTNSTSAAFSFSSSKAGSTFRCRLDAAPFALCVSPLDYTGLVAGSHTFAVVATDAIGNIDPTPPHYTWTIDTTPFGTTITSQPSNPSNSKSASFSFVAKKSGATFRCSLDNSSFSACTSPLTYSGLSEDSHTFRVKAIDNLGNEDTTPAQYTWVISMLPINTTPPNFINRGGGYFTHESLVKLSISATSEKGVTGYFASENPVKPDASEAGWVKIPSSQEFSRVVDYSLSEHAGKKRVYVWFKDDSGNISNVQSDTIYKFNSIYLIFVFTLLQVVVILAR